MKGICLLVLVSGQFLVALGQITVTASDCRALKGTADSTWNYYSADSSGLGAIIADSGADRTWDLTKRTYQLLGGSWVVRYSGFPDGAPFSNDPVFASCNMVESVGDTAAGATWYYLLVNDSGFYYYGQAVTDMKSTNVPGYESYKFPMTYGSRWGGMSRAKNIPHVRLI